MTKLFAPKKAQYHDVPIVGKIAAGKPIIALEEPAPTTLPIPKTLVSSEEVYALEVQGKSMIEDGILPGDYIIVKKQENAEEASTVVALLENEATVKKIYRHGKKIELKPANANMKSIWVQAKKCKIQGIVVALYRKYS